MTTSRPKWKRPTVQIPQGYRPLKSWIHERAQAMDLCPHAIEMRLWRGKLPYPEGITRMSRATVIVPINAP